MLFLPNVDILQGSVEGFSNRWVALCKKLMSNGAKFPQTALLLIHLLLQVLGYKDDHTKLISSSVFTIVYLSIYNALTFMMMSL